MINVGCNVDLNMSVMITFVNKNHLFDEIAQNIFYNFFSMETFFYHIYLFIGIQDTLYSILLLHRWIDEHTQNLE